MFSSNVGLYPTNTARRRKVGSTWEILAPAKLNLYLELLGHRADGFHDLETFIVPVRVHDQLLWHGSDDPDHSDQLSLRVRNLLPSQINAGQRRDEQIPGAGGGDDLVLQAARLLAKTAGIEPHGRFDLVKRIPIQAGMGGGSSDAAAALLLANNAWDLRYSRQQLQPLAAQLGSDVPFFLNQGAAICRGRGELVEHVVGLPRLHFVVAKPLAGLSTAEVFEQLPPRTGTDKSLATNSHGRLSQLIESLQCGDIAAAGQAMTNRLELAATQLAPWLVPLRKAFSKLGCLAHFMTGSGSAYVGVMRTASQARSTARRLESMNYRSGLNLGNVFATSN